MINKNLVMAAGGFLIFGAIALYLIQLSGLNADFLDNSLSTIISYSITGNMPLNFQYLIAGLLLLPLSYAFVAAYALVREKIDWLLVAAGAIMIPLSLLFMGASTTGAAFGIGMFLSGFLMQYLPIDDAKAYKELRPGRIARQALSSAIFLASVLIAAAVFAAVSGDASYSNNGINDMVDSIIRLTVDENTRLRVEAVPGGMQQLTDQVKSSEMIMLLKAYYAHMSAITAFTILEMIGILIAPIAGIYAWVLWKLSETEAKEKK